MDYTEFKEEVLKELKERHGDRAETEVNRCGKNNGTGYDGVMIRPRGGGDITVSPVFPLEPLYEAYRKGEMDTADCAGAVWESYEKNREPEGLQEFVKDIRSWDSARKNIYPVLLSAEWNRELLPGLVTVPVLDLAVGFIIRGQVHGTGCSTVRITRGMLEGYQASRQELYRAAMENLENDGYRFQSMSELLGTMLKQEGIEDMEPGMPCRREMYVLSNTSRMYGAAGILNRKLVKAFAKGRDFYILPSSVHETIFVPSGMGDNVPGLDRMVTEVNELQVEREEQLSSHCYFYDAKADEIRMRP